MAGRYGNFFSAYFCSFSIACTSVFDIYPMLYTYETCFTELDYCTDFFFFYIVFCCYSIYFSFCFTCFTFIYIFYFLIFYIPPLLFCCFSVLIIIAIFFSLSIHIVFFLYFIFPRFLISFLIVSASLFVAMSSIKMDKPIFIFTISFF